MRAKGFAPERVKFTPGPKDLPVHVSVQLGPGHRIHGRVVDEAGKPIAGVWITVEGEDYIKARYKGGYTKTDTQGRFQFDSLPASAALTFQADGYTGVFRAELPLDSDKEVVVTMKPEGVIRGRVLDSSGKPITRFNVRVNNSPDRKPGDPDIEINAELTNPGIGFSTRTGEFKITNFDWGAPLQVSVQAEGYRGIVGTRVLAKSAADPQIMKIVLSK